LKMSFREVKFRRNPHCPVCGDHPTIKELIDYDQFCGLTRGEEKKGDTDKMGIEEV
ncbi:MAG: molybdenum cofactor biosynthesis protein MoeB, partial [Candidatus Omnitrophica bacterium]|nr:molybdenum cofactor biosynthesis protein MoeB [Candidatus Omnitrophota bacterium]